MEGAEETGMSKSQVSRYETGHDRPSLVSLVKYLVAVDATVHDLGTVLEPGTALRAMARAMKLARAVRGVTTAEPTSNGAMVASAITLAAAVLAVIGHGNSGLSESKIEAELQERDTMC